METSYVRFCVLVRLAQTSTVFSSITHRSWFEEDKLSDLVGVIEQMLIREDKKSLLRREPVCKPISTVEKEEQQNDARRSSTSSISVLYPA